MNERRALLKFIAASPLLALCPALAEAWQGGDLEQAAHALDVFDFETAAQKVVPPAHWGYLMSGVDGEATLRANRDGYSRYQLKTRRFIPVNRVDMAVELLGVRFNSPIFLSPIGSSRAFCPISQIDILRTDAPAHEGRVYEFRIIEYKEGGRNLVVSRRALLEEEQRVSAAELRRSLAVGAVITGRVTSVRDFGAFVDLGGGVQGLLHVSEMGWSRVQDTSQVVKAGDQITVKVLRLDEGQQKISLGLKQLTADPWSKVLDTYEVGQVVSGRVTRVAEFGAFVELEPGVEALAHVSTFAPTGRSEEWSKTVAAGTTAAVEILSIDLDKKRIGVALVPEGSSRGRIPATAADDAAQSSEPAEREDAGFGSLADKLRGALRPREK